MAPVWGWILAYLLGFVLFQAIVYWYLQGDEPSLEEATPGYREGESRVQSAVDRGEDPPTRTGEAIQCPHCGTYNERDPVFRLCRECVRELR